VVAGWKERGVRERRWEEAHTHTTPHLSPVFSLSLFSPSFSHLFARLLDLAAQDELV
jgi:hypothetical protein